MNKKKWGLGGLLAAILAFLGIATSGNATPKAPGNLRLLADSDSLVVTWTAAPTQGSAVDGYQVTIKVNDQIATTPGTVTGLRFAWAIAGVQPGQSAALEACVEAHNNAGYGPKVCGTTTYARGDMVPGAVTIQLQVKRIP